MTLTYRHSSDFSPRLHCFISASISAYTNPAIFTNSVCLNETHHPSSECPLKTLFYLLLSHTPLKYLHYLSIFLSTSLPVSIHVISPTNPPLPFHCHRPSLDADNSDFNVILSFLFLILSWPLHSSLPNTAFIILLYSNVLTEQTNSMCLCIIKQI